MSKWCPSACLRGPAVGRADDDLMLAVVILMLGCVALALAVVGSVALTTHTTEGRDLGPARVGEPAAGERHGIPAHS